MQNFSSKKKFSIGDYEKLLEEHEVTPGSDLRLDSAFATGAARCVLRHDVDHDIETALQIAEWESALGLKTTFCLLHSTWYYGELVAGKYAHTQLLADSVRRIVDLGHEINLHNNLLTVSYQHGLDPVTLLKQELDFFSGLGIEVTGTSTHGDGLCRQFGYRNFHMFEEVTRIMPPELSDDCPERIRNMLGIVSMRELGLRYEAYGVRTRHYCADSGGNLVRKASSVGWVAGFSGSADYVVDVDKYVLTHPIWWKFND